MRLLPLALVALSLALPACSRPPGADAPAAGAATPASAASSASHIPTAAEVAAFRAEGIDPTLRKLAVADYWLHYKLLKATGLERELGGEAQAIEALRALGDAYERRVRGAEADMPKLVPAAFTGEGMASGFMGLGMGSFVAMLGGMFSGTVGTMSDAELAQRVAAGPMRFDGNGGTGEIRLGTDGSVSQAMEFEVNEKGLSGKVSVKTHFDACPDPEGKVTVTVEMDSRMSVTGKPGTGGNLHSRYTSERYLDDDAQLRTDADGMATKLDLRMGGTEQGDSQSVELTTGTERGGKPIFVHHEESGYSIFRPEEVARTRELLQGVEFMNALVAEALLRGMGGGTGPAWEGGRCVQLQVGSEPAKRSGIRPNTAFDLEAMPRAKADGAPTGGTVVATLDGGASLQPSTGKVRADARYQYAGPEEKDQQASIAFEARSKRGVGRATLVFDTKAQHAYRISGMGDCPGPWTVCDVTRPFTFDVCGGTMTHTPDGERSGRQTFQHSGARGSGAYTLEGPPEAMTATYTNTTCARGRCFKTPNGKATWTKIDACE